jgi:predicted dithiol-disulfide oxidoreductase (DUF899 family)
LHQIFHTYGTFGRGSEQFMGIYGYLDVLPKGREEVRTESRASGLGEGS